MSLPAAISKQPDAPPRGFWRRRLVDPILAQLTQGVTPDKIAATLAVGAACALFPFLGATALLCLIVGIPLRMNQPILQTLNQLLGPLHLVMILVYVRLGEWLWRAPGDRRFSVLGMIRDFADLPLGEFFQKFGLAGLHALTAWALTTPLLVVLVYYTTRPALRRFARRSGERSPPRADIRPAGPRV